MTYFNALVDPYGRRITNLRISLTDLCNFRCVYCMPPEGLQWLPRTYYLTRGEILRFVHLMGRLGVHRVRLTGGEPLLREDILDIVRALKSVETVDDLSITTNGSYLEPLLRPLKDAGLDRINISLDSLDPKRFQEITLSPLYSQVIRVVFQALDFGFPVKLNMVVLNGLSSHDIKNLAQLAHDFPLEARFLEFMPLCGTGWKPEWVFPIAKVKAIIREHFELEPLPRHDNVAETFKIKGGRGRIGFIASLTENFCDQCSRIRLTADGNIRPCLFSNTEVSVRKLLREEAPDEKIVEAIRLAVSLKPKGNWFQDHPFQEGETTDYPGYEKNPAIHSVGG